jgi:hypothetical protein
MSIQVKFNEQGLSEWVNWLESYAAGLGEQDLYELLSQQEGTMLPPVVFARLLTGIRGLLKPRAGDT